ncbi:hypothetical protein GTP90_01080 [Rugamonas sp. FT81W]|uniref:Uncharacterized protein n=1 Tax=Duganella vulcania TaxID=2692166 RepID=A0A845GIF4_9BURK|nr:hypothetical protein [Duganella vulcania]
MAVQPGQTVRVESIQRRLGGPRYPNRIGVVRERNALGRDSGGLWYVELQATTRAKARVTLFWGDELIPLAGCVQAGDHSR